jgi:hypothetical protein
LQPSGRRGNLENVLRDAAAGVVILASAAAALAAFVPDLRTAYLYAGPSVFSDVDRRQMSTVREAIPDGATLLLVAKRSGAWHARLWQRGLYPRNQVVVVMEPYDAAAVRAVRDRYAIRHAVLVGPPPFDPGLRWSRDLGPLAGLPDRVSFGELSP